MVQFEFFKAVLMYSAAFGKPRVMWLTTYTLIHYINFCKKWTYFKAFKATNEEQRPTKTWLKNLLQRLMRTFSSKA